MSKKSANKSEPAIVAAKDKPNLAKPGTVGFINDPNTLFLRHAIGNVANNETGDSYEITANVADYTPIVRSSRTGKWFTLCWQDIVELAVAAGIDEGPEKRK